MVTFPMVGIYIEALLSKIRLVQDKLILSFMGSTPTFSRTSFSKFLSAATFKHMQPSLSHSVLTL